MSYSEDLDFSRSLCSLLASSPLGGLDAPTSSRESTTARRSRRGRIGGTQRRSKSPKSPGCVLHPYTLCILIQCSCDARAPSLSPRKRPRQTVEEQEGSSTE